MFDEPHSLWRFGATSYLNSLWFTVLWQVLVVSKKVMETQSALLLYALSKYCIIWQWKNYLGSNLYISWVIRCSFNSFIIRYMNWCSCYTPMLGLYVECALALFRSMPYVSKEPTVLAHLGSQQTSEIKLTVWQCHISSQSPLVIEDARFYDNSDHRANSLICASNKSRRSRGGTRDTCWTYRARFFTCEKRQPKQPGISWDATYFFSQIRLCGLKKSHG